MTPHSARGAQFNESKSGLSEDNDSGTTSSSDVLLHRMQPSASDGGPTIRVDLRSDLASDPFFKPAQGMRRDDGIGLFILRECQACRF